MPSEGCVEVQPRVDGNRDRGRAVRYRQGPGVGEDWAWGGSSGVPMASPAWTPARDGFLRRFGAAQKPRRRREPFVRAGGRHTVVERRPPDRCQALGDHDDDQAADLRRHCEPVTLHHSHQVARSARTCAAAGAAGPPNQSRSPPNESPTPKSSGTTEGRRSGRGSARRGCSSRAGQPHLRPPPPPSATACRAGPALRRWPRVS